MTLHFWSEIKMYRVAVIIMPHGGHIVQLSIQGSLWPDNRVGLTINRPNYKYYCTNGPSLTHACKSQTHPSAKYSHDSRLINASMANVITSDEYNIDGNTRVT